jgi:5-methylcytosine-specific restriction endonuclease McrA
MTLLLDAPATLACGTCREVKPISAFYRDSSRSTGRQRHCSECQKARSAQRHTQRRDTHLAQMREYDRAHRDQARARYAKPTKKAQNAAWLCANRVKMTERQARRRALKMSVASVVTERDLRRLVARHGGCCAYCKTALATAMDHVVPLARGGQHAIGNLLPACTPCNSSKRDRLLVEWRR